jgi:hypothetical protein
MMTTEALAIYQNIESGLILIKEMGETFFESGMSGCKSLAQGKMLAMGCISEHLNPISFLNKYHIIEEWNKNPNARKTYSLTRQSRSLHAEFITRGGRATVVKSTKDMCHMIFKSPEYEGEYEVILTMKEMMESGIPKGKNGIKDNWRRNPKAMLQVRVLADGVKITMPTVLAGMPTQEEMQDELSSDNIKVEVVTPDAKQLEEHAETVETVDIAETPVEKIEVENPDPDPDPDPEPEQPPDEYDGLSKNAIKVMKWIEGYFIPDHRKLLEDYVGRKLGVDTVPATMWKDDEMPLLRQLRDYIVKIEDSAERQQALEKALAVAKE